MIYTLAATWTYDGATVGASAESQHEADDIPGVVERMLSSDPHEITIKRQRQAVKATARDIE